jgi:hypothetical protein
MGDVDLTLTAYALNDCPDIATDMVTLTIGLLPTVYAGDDGLSCEDSYYQTLGWTNNAWTILWTTDGDGYFDDATSTLAKYFPGSGDIASGSVVLTLTAQAVPPCTTPVSDDVVVTFQSLPSAYAGPDGTVCGNATYQLSGTASDYSSAMWSTSGDGTFNNPGLLNAILYTRCR